MTGPPAKPAIYHITHVDNLPLILRDGVLWSDAQLLARGGPKESIGMGGIKQRRLKLPVRCHPGDCVGDYVPFYFCPRSIMLYLIYRANHSELAYRGGQDPILHLEFDLHEVAAWADEFPRRWAFSLSNAGAFYSEFRASMQQLGEINWAAVAATDFRMASVKEGKQAEFMVHESVPWELVRRIGVRTESVRKAVLRVLVGGGHRPAVELCPSWYF